LRCGDWLASFFTGWKPSHSTILVISATPILRLFDSTCEFRIIDLRLVINTVGDSFLRERQQVIDGNLLPQARG
jgi:hypothetical protein